MNCRIRCNDWFAKAGCLFIYAAFTLLRGAGAPCKRPWVVRSSSRSGQCIPYPAPAMRQFARASGVACSNRGYHAKGTVMVRPSKRSTLMESSVTCTSLTRSPDLGSEVLIPCLQELFLVFRCQCFQCPQLPRRKPKIICQRHRLKPELR